MKNAKKNIIGVNNIGVLVDENEWKYFKMNENEINLMGNLYDHGLPIFGKELFLK